MGNPLDNIQDYLKNIPTCKVCPKGASTGDIPPRPAKVSGWRFKGFLATIVAIIFVSGGFYYFNPGITYASHLNKARVALDKLETALNGTQPTSLIPSVYAEDGLTIDEEAVAELTEEVVQETEAAIEDVEEMDDAEATAEALEEVSEVQEETIDVLSDATEIVTSDELGELIAAALLATSDAQDEVENALDEVAGALANGEVEVEVEVMSSINGVRNRLTEEDAAALAETAVNDLMDLIASGYGTEEEVAKIQAKIAMIEEALEEGQAGRVKGLSTAMHAKIRNIRRKTEDTVSAIHVEADETISEPEDTDTDEANEETEEPSEVSGETESDEVPAPAKQKPEKPEKGSKPAIPSNENKSEKKS